MIVPIIMGNIFLQNKNIELLELVESSIEIAVITISITQTIKVRRVVNWEYKVLEIGNTRRGVNIYISKHSRPIYVPLEWLTFNKSETKNQYILSFTKAILFNSKDKPMVISGGEIVLTDKCLDFKEVTSYIDLLKDLQENANAILKDYKPDTGYMEQYVENSYNFKSAKSLPWIMIMVNLIVAFFIIKIGSTVVNTGGVHYQANKISRPVVYHKIIDYKPGMTAKVKNYNLKIRHAYLTKSDSGTEYIILNIKAKIKGSNSVDASYFSSFKKWSISKEKNFEILDSADAHPSFNVKINGDKKSVINILTNVWNTNDGYTPSLFNVILKKGSGKSADILFDNIISKKSNGSFVMTIKSKDLEKLK